MPGRRGFRVSNSIASGANVTSVLMFYAEDKAAGRLIGDVPPYVFDENGRISTSSHAGAAITVPDSYTLGEMWELRWTFAETGNSQRQGVFLEVRTSAANTSTIRGAEVHAAQEGAVAVGTLEGGSFQAITRSTSTGNITNMFGLTGEITHNSANYTGTVTLAAGVRAKISLEDGATYTEVYGVYVDGEPISGADTATAIFGSNTHANLTFTSAIDVSGSVLAETDTATDVTLIRFTAADGSIYRVVHDTDAATVLAVVTD